MSIDRNLFTARRKPSLGHAIAVGALALAGMAVPLALWASGHVVNVSASLDQRLIQTVPIAAAQRGNYISFCRPLPLGNIPPGNCPDGTAPLVKRVIAIAGDTVLYTPTEIRVDAPSGWFDIHPMRHIHAGRDDVKVRYPHPTYGRPALVLEGQVIVQGDHPASVDSRYFGAVSDPARDWTRTHIPALENWILEEPAQ